MTTAAGDLSQDRDVLLDNLLGRLPVIVFAAGLDGVCTYSEGSGLDALALAGGQMVGVDLFEAYAGRPRELGHLRDVLDGHARSYTWREGDSAFDVWISPTFAADGRVDGLLGISVDVTDRVRARDDLELYRAFVDASPQFVALADLDGAVRYVNPGGRRMAGLPDDLDVTATTVADYLTEEGLRLSLEVEQPAVVAHGSYEGETTLRHWPTGRGIPVRVSSFLVTDHVTGGPRALATVQTDISAQLEVERESERRLSQQRGLLLHLHEAQETERRRIAHGVHDDTIQSVAAAGIRVQTALRLLEGRAPDVEQVLGGAVDAVAEAADQLRRMLVWLDVPDRLEQDLVAGLREHLAQVCRDEPFASEVRGSLREPPPVHVSRVLFRIAQEALANVRTHAAAENVEVQVAESDAGYTLSVRDDGRGVPPALALPARGRPARVAGHMGLRSMAERAESLGGWCSVRGLDATEGGGTLVEAWVPAWPDYSSRATGPGQRHAVAEPSRADDGEHLGGFRRAGPPLALRLRQPGRRRPRAAARPAGEGVLGRVRVLARDRGRLPRRGPPAATYGGPGALPGPGTLGREPGLPEPGRCGRVLPGRDRGARPRGTGRPATEGDLERPGAGVRPRRRT